MGNKTKESFRSFFTGYEELKSSGEEPAFGVLDKGLPCGVVFLRKEKSDLIIRSIRIDYAAPDADKTMLSILSGLFENLRAWGFERMLLRYADDEPVINSRLLKEAGFGGFREESEVYRIDAYNLGSILRDGPDSSIMRRQAVKILDEGRTRVFSLAPESALKLFQELDPVKKLSYMTINDKGEPVAAVCVSAFSDGSLCLSGIDTAEDGREDLLGLLYLSLASVFLEIEPGGDFYLAVVNPKLETLVNRLFGPLLGQIEEQKIICAFGGVSGDGSF